MHTFFSTYNKELQRPKRAAKYSRSALVYGFVEAVPRSLIQGTTLDDTYQSTSRHFYKKQGLSQELTQKRVQALDDVFD